MKTLAQKLLLFCLLSFSVNFAWGQTISLSPNFGEQNSSFAVTVTGTGTTWSSNHCVEFNDGVSTFSFNGVAVATSIITGTLNIPMGANVSAGYDVTVFDLNTGSCTGISDGTCTNCFTVTPAISVVSISNNNIQQCDAFAVTVSGTNTSWASGTTHCVELSDGVSTFSFTGTANASQQLTGTIDVPANANPSSNYDITVYDVNGGACTGISDGTCNNCFTVSAAPTISLSPSTGEQNSSFSVTITGTGTTWSSNHCVEFDDGVSTFSFNGVAVAASTITGTLNIPAGANVSSNYDVKVYNDILGNCSGANDGICQNCFSVTVAVPVVSISNNNIQQCDAFAVTVSGTNTSWASGTTHCVELSDGVSTFSFTGTANASQQLTGTIDVPADANASSNYDITVYDVDGGACTGMSDGTCSNCFTVSAAPTISLSPSTGEQNSSFSVTITGVGTTWSSNHCVEFDDGVSTFSFNGVAVAASTITGTLNIPAGANVSSNYDVKVYNDILGNCSGANDGICQNCFTVTAAIPVVSISPNSGEQCDAFAVTVSGTNTSWASGTTHCVEITDGFSTFNFTGTANNSQQLSGTLEVPIDAMPGSSYDITVYDVDGGACTGMSDGTCTDCFTVTAAPIVTPTPNTGLQNTSFSVTLTGMGTTWSSSHCVEVSDGISTITFVAVATNASTLIGTINIPMTANPSPNYNIKVYDHNMGNCSGDIDGLCASCFSVTMGLPVEWLSFSATSASDGVHLDWKTATEVNSAYFEVQRSTNARDWEPLGQLNAQGFSTAVSSYDYLDQKPQQGVNYYRIEQVDLDGQKSYTAIESVTIGDLDRLFDVFPNPTKDEVNILFNSDQSTQADITIQDIYGKTVIVKNAWDVRDNPNISLADLPAGVYFIRIQQGNQQGVQQIVKQ